MERLSTSRLRSFRRCARLHHHQYVDRLRPVAEPEALTLGTLVHAGLEQVWRGEPLTRHQPTAPWWVGVLADELVAGYVAHWPAPTGVLGVEVPFDVPLIDPDTFSQSDRWRFTGRIDAIVGGWVVEHKTTTADISPASNYWLKLQMDDQCSAYIIGAESVGVPVQGVIYDVVRTYGLKPLAATPEASRKYTKAGTLYAQQRDRDESPEEYRARVREMIASDPGAYYRRHEVPRTAEQVAGFLRDAWADAQRIDAVREYAPRNPDACHAGAPCAFWGFCSTGSDPKESSQFITRSKP